MCSRLLRSPKREGGNWQDRLEIWLDKRFERLHVRYEKTLHGTLNFVTVIAIFALVVMGGIYFLYTTSMSELAPQEDQGVLIAASFNAPDATLQQREIFGEQVQKTFKSHPETDHIFQLNMPTQVITGMVLKPWNERAKTSIQLQPEVQNELRKIAGTQSALFQPPPLPGARGLPIQFVITSTEPFSKLYDVSQKFLQEAEKTGEFIFVQSDLRIDLPQTTVVH